MYRIIFYRDSKGREPIWEYLQGLARRSDKDSRIKINKIYDYLELLSQVGIAAGEPYIKHLEDEIWEVRPLRDRILFAHWDGESFILLHHFMKESQRTPKREIEQAKNNLADYRERGGEDEQKAK